MIALWCLVACSENVDALSGGPLEGQIHGWAFDVHLLETAPVDVHCIAVADPVEHHVVRSSAALDHHIVVLGLLADTAYRCVATAGAYRAEGTIRTDPLSRGMPTWSTEVSGAPVGAYTLFNHGLMRTEEPQPQLLIVDREGRIRWSWRSEQDHIGLDATYLGDSRILVGRGSAGPLLVIGLDGHVMHEGIAALNGGFFHHHTAPIETGEIAALTETTNTDRTNRWLGFGLEVFTPDLQERAWSFDSQQAYDAGWLPPGREDQDRYHANRFDFVGDDVYVNLRHLDWLVAFDRHTSEHRFTLGLGGDFALLDANGKPLGDDQWFQAAHAPVRHGDRLLIHDNHAHPPVRRSRILELVLDEHARTATVTWTFEDDGWYEPIWGDLQVLEGGHLLLLRSHCSFCPTALDLTSQIVEVDRATDEVVWRLVFDDRDAHVGSAQRIDGCALFANRAYCPRP